MKWYIKIEVMNLLRITVVKYRGSERVDKARFELLYMKSEEHAIVVKMDFGVFRDFIYNYIEHEWDDSFNEGFNLGCSRADLDDDNSPKN